MDFIIIYERKQRELENAILLKIELEKRGYSCGIYQYYEADKFKESAKKRAKIILVPHLYNTKSIPRTFLRFGYADHIVNLQYEQVLSKKWEKLGHHNPREEAEKAIHICWGDNTKERLINAGLKEGNVKTLGALQCDLLRKEYREKKEHVKKRLGEKCRLNTSKNWNVFLSSFTYADISDDRLKMNENVAGTSLKDFKTIHTNSRDELLKWFDKILIKMKDELFIYRPHPDELSLEKVEILERKYKNFIIIRDFAVKEWIASSEKLYTWYSTSIVEAHFLDIPYSILRPRKLPENFDSVLLKHGNFITNYEDFEDDFFLKEVERKKAIDDIHMNGYYKINKENPAYIEYVDFLEELLKRPKQEYDISLKEKIKSKIVTQEIIFLFKLYKLYRRFFKINYKSKNLFMKWFIEWENQIVTEKEKEKILKNIKSIIEKKKY